MNLDASFCDARNHSRNVIYERLVPYFDKLQQLSHQILKPLYALLFMILEEDTTTLTNTSAWMLGPIYW